MTNHSVDILMATYNGEKYLAAQIDSIIKQTFTDWRLIISDDCSSDATLQIARKYAEIDDRIYVLENKERFACAKGNFVNLIHFSDADYSMFCDQDDYWLPLKIQQSVENMSEMENKYGYSCPLLVFTDMQVVNDNLEVIAYSFEAYSGLNPTRNKFSQLLAQSIGAGCTMLMNRSLRELFEKTPDSQMMIMHDWWLTLIASAFGQIGHVDEPTSLYRQHDENSVGAVRYSPIKRVRTVDAMVDSVRLTLVQADSFKSVYRKMLPESKKIILDEYVALLNSKGVFRYKHLYKIGAWKSGLRKIGQLLAISKL